MAVIPHVLPATKGSTPPRESPVLWLSGLRKPRVESLYQDSIIVSGSVFTQMETWQQVCPHIGSPKERINLIIRTRRIIIRVLPYPTLEWQEEEITSRRDSVIQQYERHHWRITRKCRKRARTCEGFEFFITFYASKYTTPSSFSSRTYNGPPRHIIQDAHMALLEDDQVYLEILTSSTTILVNGIVNPIPMVHPNMIVSIGEKRFSQRSRVRRSHICQKLYFIISLFLIILRKKNRKMKSQNQIKYTEVRF